MLRGSFFDLSVANSVDSRVVARYNAIDDSTTQRADFFHGTLVASMIVLNAVYNGIPYVGSAPGASIISVEIFALGVEFNETVLSRAVNYILNNKDNYNIRIAVCSWGFRDFYSDGVIGYNYTSGTYHRDWAAYQLSRLVQANIIVTIAINEDARPQVSSPETLLGGIGVGATDPMGTANRDDDTLADFTGRGPTRHYVVRPRVKPDVVAPGIIQVPPYRGYPDSNIPLTVVEGTSFANPLVAGGIAQMVQAVPSLRPAQIIAILRDSAYRGNTNLGTAWPNVDSGWGLADIYNAINYATQGILNKDLMVDHYYISDGSTGSYISIDTSPVTASGPSFWDGRAFRIGAMFSTVSYVIFDLDFYRSGTWYDVVYAINTPYASYSTGYNLWDPNYLAQRLTYVTAYASTNDTYVFTARLDTPEFYVVLVIELRNSAVGYDVYVGPYPKSALYYTVIDVDYRGSSGDYAVVNGVTINVETKITSCGKPNIITEIRDTYYPGYIGMTVSSGVYYYSACSTIWVLRYQYGVQYTSNPDNYLNNENVYGTDIVIVISGASATGPTYTSATWIDLDFSNT